MKPDKNKKKTPTLSLLFIGINTILLITLLYGSYFNSDNDKSNKVNTIKKGDNWNFVNKLEQREMLSRAGALFTMYFDTDVIILSYESGPSGSLIINADIDDEKRQFLMLADKDHLIEGVIYSPYLSADNISLSHSTKTKAIAYDNQKNIDQVNRIKKSFKNDVAKQNKKVSDKHPADSSNIKSPFKLPEINSVLSTEDKKRFFTKTQKLQYIEIGNSNAPMIYVYFDFDCSGCKQAKKSLEKFTSANQLRVRYIPVGLISKDSPIKAAYSLIPDNNEDRKTLFQYFNQAGSAEKLIQSKAPKDEVLKGISYVRDANNTFMFTPKKLTPTFVFELNQEVVIANLTNERSIKTLVNSLSHNALTR